jgi:hypothetical protein
VLRCCSGVLRLASAGNGSERVNLLLPIIFIRKRLQDKVEYTTQSRDLYCAQNFIRRGSPLTNG